MEEAVVAEATMMMMGVVVEGEGMIRKIKIRKIGSARRPGRFRSTIELRGIQIIMAPVRDYMRMTKNIRLPGQRVEKFAVNLSQMKSITRRAMSIRGKERVTRGVVEYSQKPCQRDIGDLRREEKNRG